VKPIRWHELEFRHLEYAIALKKHRNFIQAAIALNLDQGFLSKQIKRLEGRLGIEIFDRSTRPLGLTEAGQVFLTRAEQIIDQVQKAVELSQETQAGKRGRLDVGINTSVANSKLPDLIRQFREQVPQVNLMLHELASYDQIEQLKTHQLDIGFFHRHNLKNLPAADRTTFTETVILTEPLVLVLPEQHPLAQHRIISLADLSSEPFVLPPHTLLHGLRDQIDQLCLRAQCQPVVVQEAAWITTVLSLVAGGMGVSLLPANVKNLQRSGVIYRDIQDPSPILEIVAVNRMDNPSAILKNFLQILNLETEA
jgi:DNA-binding transcriptional LysR family regulator